MGLWRWWIRLLVILIAGWLTFGLTGDFGSSILLIAILGYFEFKPKDL